MNINRTIIGKSKLSKIIPQLQIIARQWGLDIKKVKDFNTAKRILIRSVECN